MAYPRGKPNPNAGRPTIYTEQLADNICERIANGETLRAICREDGMPDRQSVLNWLKKNEDFSAKYAIAREHQAEFIAEETIEIADSAVDIESANCAKVRIAARQWFAGKVAPKKYGDRTEITGAGGTPLIPQLDMAEVSRRMVYLLSAAAMGLTGRADANETQGEVIDGEAKQLPDGGVSDP